MLNFDTAFIVQIINTILLVAVLYVVYALLFKYPKQSKKDLKALKSASRTLRRSCDWVTRV
ncbi:hypothetical protein [Acidaminobacter sp.]|uniref:hypothetical protein n=1 Tax=Acidaminobacter sp. TaxID=1872102 RepID=UPI001382C297|nr:hypothetical protein [Acidaminobacter sp.]MDK9711402.1 hypothetical protein [Acidaminobacter sp.]MZQ97073.1 hypothetical protein [Acidaminobacter sp.]